MKKVRLGASTMLFPMPAVLVGVNVEDKPNFITVAWSGIACGEPPTVSIALRQVRFSLKGIKEHGEFSINIPTTEMVKEVDYCGLYSGDKVDKSNIFNLFEGKETKAPLIKNCPINLECKMVHLINLGTHTLVIGHILETHISDDCLHKGKPVPEKINPLIYAPGIREYYGLGPLIGKAFKVGEKK